MNEISKQLSEMELFLSQYRNINTKRSYERSLRSFYTFLGTYYPALKSLDDVNLEMIIDFQAKLSDSQEPQSVNSTISAVRKFFDYLTIRGIITNNQIKALKPIPINRRDQKTSYMNEEEVKRLMTYTNKLGNSPYDISNKILILMLLNSGMRNSEMSALKLKNMTKKGGHYFIEVLGKGGRLRHVTLPKEVSDRLDELIKDFEGVAYKLDKDDYLIQRSSITSFEKAEGPLSRSSMVDRITQLAKGAGIEKDITTHSLRRTLATLLYGKGVPIENIQRIMGHDNIRTTMSYIDADMDKAVSLKYAINIT